uniref:7TM_GPCR_Srx domain-containing protein n=1 Tax=Angiostrongylus cantonensis TaxID=6313 RepID=A0A0K0D7V4_ANGCA
LHQLSLLQRACFYVAVSALVLCLFSAGCIFFGVYSVNLWLDIALILLNAVAAIFVLIGLYGNKASFLIPFIVSEIAQCIGFFILATYTLYYTIVIKRQRFYQKFGMSFLLPAVNISSLRVLS